MYQLNETLAQGFIEKIASDLEFNVNIMNEKGIIIASKDASRIGDFHEIAYGLVRGKLESGIVNEERKYIGTKPGVNLTIRYSGENVGVICVTGDPDRVNSFAHLVQTSLEALLEYEIHREQKRILKNNVDQFLFYLLFEKDVDFKTASEMAQKTGIQQNLIRAALIIKSHKQSDPEGLIRRAVERDVLSTADLVTESRNGDILIFKHIESHGQNPTGEFRLIISECVESLFSSLEGEFTREDFTIYAGSAQKSIKNYRSSYLHAFYLTQHFKSKGEIIYFEDNILDFLRSRVQEQEYESIFAMYTHLFTEKERDTFVATVESLRKNNYNVVGCAKELFVHRNTVVFRLNKIRDLLKIDPMSSAENREFLNELSYYFRKFAK